MWVADMDFETAPPVAEAITRRAAHGIFGYASLPEDLFSSYIDWWRDRHGFTMRREWMTYCTGVVPAISSAVRRFTAPGEKILLATPVYNIFFHSISHNGRRPRPLPLDYRDRRFSLDLAALERALDDPKVTMLLLCNPHNPCGVVWERDTLAAIGQICARRHIVVLSDEIHCDLTDPGVAYTPFLSVSDACREVGISCLSPTKAFNLAGVQSAMVVTANEALRSRMARAINDDEVGEANVFAPPATIAAFREGGPWLDALREVLFANRTLVQDFLAAELPQISLVRSQATYLLFLDCRALLPKGDSPAASSSSLAAFLRREAGLYLNPGDIYGEGGETFLRMNIACPRARLEEGLRRLREGVRLWQAR